MIPSAFRRPLETATFRFENTAAAVRGWLRGNRVAAYWYIGARNFGDRLTPLLLEHYGLTAVHARAARSGIVVVGSVLGGVPSDYDGVVLGAGLLEDAPHPLTRAQVLGVRGSLTRELVGAPADVVLGDPGLLAPRLFERAPEKAFAIGLVPHYVDQSDSRVRRLAARLGGRVTVIDVTKRPREVLAEIDRCESVLSSSLHGVVVADALGIPNAWIALSDRVVGASFKFRDYGSAIGRTIEPRALDGGESVEELVSLTTSAPSSVSSVQAELHKAFVGLHDVLGSSA